MKSILFSWIGFTDLKASRGEKNLGIGPIAQAVVERSFQEIFLISDVPDSDCKEYVKWLKTFTSAHIQIKKASLSSARWLNCRPAVQRSRKRSPAFMPGRL